MTRSRALLNAAILFIGVGLMLGIPGIMMIETRETLAVYAIGVLGFASWLSWGTYQDAAQSWTTPVPDKTVVAGLDDTPIDDIRLRPKEKSSAQRRVFSQSQDLSA